VVGVSFPNRMRCTRCVRSSWIQSSANGACSRAYDSGFLMLSEVTQFYKETNRTSSNIYTSFG
jgi:hypothetical protein